MRRTRLIELFSNVRMCQGGRATYDVIVFKDAERLDRAKAAKYDEHTEQEESGGPVWIG